jgi:hypothetical protein
MYLNGSTIARLTATSRMSANRHLRARLYGDPIVVDGVLYVERAAVEHRAGVEFSPAQLAAAGVHLPDPEPEE